MLYSMICASTIQHIQYTVCPCRAMLRQVGDLLDKLNDTEWARLLVFWKPYVGQSNAFRLGTMCSGTDLIVRFIECLAEQVSSRSADHTPIRVAHCVAAENCKAKQAWIRGNFPGLQCLVGDVNALTKKQTVNILSNTAVVVPADLDLLVLFLQKSFFREQEQAEIWQVSEGGHRQQRRDVYSHQGSSHTVQYMHTVTLQ